MRTTILSIIVAFLAIGCGTLYLYEVYDRDSQLSQLNALNSNLDLNNSSVLVVGATAGIGRAIALRFAKANASVSVVGRTVSKGTALVEEMHNITSSISFGSNVTANSLDSGKDRHAFYAYDVSLLANARALAEEYKQTHTSLDYLVLSPCIATIQGRTETTEGNDVKMTLHYYTRIALIEALSDVLKTGKGRVLSVLSGGEHSLYTGYSSDVELKTDYSIANAANAAGFYTDVAFSILRDKYPHLTLFHSSPGFVASDWGTEMPSWLRVLIRVLQASFATSTEACAEFMCAPLFDDTIAKGFHVRGSRGEVAQESVGIEQARDTVWAHTLDVLK
ncbi:hypothetical protein SARC_13654 [Sphaeroforma arctica JP610]|uniref:NAD(P)-binding protein n=1 Tax=Sphaeroforma arctica JP610 TaxID=667725 RepID=A0A0L0FAM0_9EUKA|nr:hypothetical protein SARC_13654 [Sphaeroforma arctica JP610]KNC73789.1 hypothetical protein SARC_13654 [Sphaeroforma arctica JP610]|eukprot:XP_014147691.1 hypothetical protein SARC_13654 [Sphaeroforma arctica JP610]